jgi:uncharacterized protein
MEGEMATNERVLATPTTAPARVGQLSMSALVALHLVPGALMTAVFVLLAPAVERVGFPPIAALLAAIVLVLLPFELAAVIWAGRGAEHPFAAAVPFRVPLGRRQWLWLVPVLVVLAFLGFGLHMAIEPQLITALFGWLPDWFIHPIDPDRIGEYAAGAWIATLVAYFALNGLVGPIVEELYFRGVLLPRMERLGRWAPLVNVSLFSLYHFWSPWQLVARILGIGPTVYAVWWKRNVYLGMVVHCTLNSLGVLLVASLVLGRL